MYQETSRPIRTAIALANALKRIGDHGERTPQRARCVATRNESKRKRQLQTRWINTSSAGTRRRTYLSRPYHRRHTNNPNPLAARCLQSRLAVSATAPKATHHLHFPGHEDHPRRNLWSRRCCYQIQGRRRGNPTGQRHCLRSRCRCVHAKPEPGDHDRAPTQGRHCVDQLCEPVEFSCAVWRFQTERYREGVG